MTFQAVVNSEGRPIVITKSQELVDRTLEDGGVLAPSVPPRSGSATERRWKFDFPTQSWGIDIESEKEIRDSRDVRRQQFIDARNAFAQSRNILKSDTLSNAENLTLHRNMLIMLKALSID